MLTVYLKVDGEEDFIISHQEFSLISADENIWSSLVCLCSLPTTYHVDVDAQTLRMGTGFSGGLSSITGEYNGQLRSSEVLELLILPFQDLTQCLALCRLSLNAQEMRVWMNEQRNVWPFMMLLKYFSLTWFPQCLLVKRTQVKEKCVIIFFNVLS